MPGPRISEFFAGKNIFITGATGFLGKVLIEKLLRCCGDVGDIYVLIRVKKSKSVQERMKEMLENPLYDTIRENYPERMKKLKVVQGNASEVNLGMSKEDWTLLTENVHIIYHMAASIRFDDPLQYAIFMNVRSTKTIIELAHEIKNFVLLVYVSTAYCNIDRNVLEEKLYPAHGDWREAIEIAENADTRTLDLLSHKYIGCMQNTYLYTKSLAEGVMRDLCSGKIPAIIIRPSIVVSIAYDPLPGWTDNLNGPLGISMAVTKGVLRVIFGKSDTPLNMVPVDIVIANTIVATYKHGLNRTKTQELEVYNSCNPLEPPYTMGDVIKNGVERIDENPYEKTLWYPRVTVTNSSLNYYVQIILFHLIPALFLDVVLRIIGKQPMFLKIQRKVFLASTVMVHFMRTRWDFRFDKLKDLDAVVPVEDRKKYCLHETLRNSDYDELRELQNVMARGILRHVFKEDAGPKYLPMLKRLWLLDVGIKAILFVVVTWHLFVKWDMVGKLSTSMANYFESIPILIP